MTNIIPQIQALFKKTADAAVREGGRRFFKPHETIKSYGVKTAIVLKIAQSYSGTLKTLKKADVFALCEKLWESGYMEEAFVACDWSYRVRKHYGPEDFARFEKWVSRYVDNWAACDTLCNHTIGTLVEMYPKLTDGLLRWTKSSNRWLKRGAAVSLIVPARKGLFLDTVFEISDRLLTDSDDLVQKGYGWMLKAASQAHAKEVFDYLMAKRAVMRRTAFRYALEKMPPKWRAQAMKK